ncbi:aspartic peptidase domain-containing protein [Xylariales sp. PMI_506]|nr:aspartic peptidase domain-containing protein [Xylariales sp. PMI_506]
MVYASTSVILTAGLAAVAAAAPTVSLPGHRKAGFSVPQVRANGYVKHGPSAMAKALLKFGKTVPTELAATIESFRESRMLAKRTNGSAVNTPEQYDTEYLTPVSIGTPAQTLNLDFDSGSADLWVFSSLTTSSDVDGQTIYTPTDSSTATEVSGDTWDISYGDGSSSSGDVYTDTVTVGGVTFASQAVEVATKVSSSFTSDSANDGLLGLAFSTINTVQPNSVNTFFDNVRSSLDQSLWTADLKYEAEGTYNFGWIDDSLYTGTISYTDVDSSEGYWMFTASGYSVGDSTTSSSSSAAPASTTSSTDSNAADTSGTSGSSDTVTTTITVTAGAATATATASSSDSGHHHGHNSNTNSNTDNENDFFGGFFRSVRRQFGGGGGGNGNGNGQGSGTGSSTGSTSSTSTSSASSSAITGIADTGTTLAMFPTSVCEAYYEQVSGAEYSNSAGGYVFSCDTTLPDFSYVVGDNTITIPSEYLNYSPIDTSGETCYGGIQPDTDIGFSIFGDVALKAAFVVFQDDGSGSPQLGFASKDTSS